MLSLQLFLPLSRLGFKQRMLTLCTGALVISCGVDQSYRLDDREPTSGDDASTSTAEGTGGRRGSGEGTQSGGSSDGPWGGAEGMGGQQGGGSGLGGGRAADPDAFVTRWEVGDASIDVGGPWELPSDEEKRTVRLPLISGGEYDFVVEWGDGTTGRVTAPDDKDASHVYQEQGSYEVVLLGKIKGWAFPAYGVEHYPMVKRLREVKQWGSLKLGKEAFEGCNLEITAQDTPQLAKNLTRMFYRCRVSFAEGAANWDTSNVTNMSYMFQRSTLDGDLSHWDTSRVTDMRAMFASSYACYEYDNTEEEYEEYYDDTYCVRGESPTGDLSGWDTSRVTDMSYMFSSNRKFNGDISQWDTSQVTDMRSMFYDSVFNGDISSWDTSQVLDMRSMFEDSVFNGDISSWDTSGVTSMHWMFNGSRFNGDISSWDVSNVETMWGMFGASIFNGDLSNWDTSNVNVMAEMFARSKFDGDISSWDVSAVRYMWSMFGDSEALSTQNYDKILQGWAPQEVLAGVDFDAGSARYSVAAAPARSILVSKGWTISDGGMIE